MKCLTLPRKRREKLIHKTIEKNGKSFYLCNQAYYSNYYKTTQYDYKVTCKNCLKRGKE